MSEPDNAALPEPATQAAPEELPPVQPPSAGFIMQLFLIPAIIVAAVIGVWVLFGRMAGAEQDWRQLVQDLGSANEHRRWRAASGLANLLNADRQRNEDRLKNMSPEFAKATGVDQEIPLAQNEEIATELVKLMDAQLEQRTNSAEDVTHQEFLARTLGSLDLPDVVLPSLQRAIAPEYDEKVRASALTSIAMIAHRASTRDEPIESVDLVRGLIESSTDESTLIKQFSAYALGLLPSDESLEHLTALLADADEMTRVNAAVGLARNDRPEGFDVFAEVLQSTADKPGKEQLSKMNDADRVTAMNRYQIEQPMMLNASLTALTGLVEQLNPEQKSELSVLLKPIAEGYEQAKLRTDADTLLKKIK